MEIWPPDVETYFEDNEDDYDEIVARHVANCKLAERDIYCKVCNEM